MKFCLSTLFLGTGGGGGAWRASAPHYFARKIVIRMFTARYASSAKHRNECDPTFIAVEKVVNM